jgi:hypothetical protein
MCQKLLERVSWEPDSLNDLHARLLQRPSLVQLRAKLRIIPTHYTNVDRRAISTGQQRHHTTWPEC